ncbi:uncharacterized protein LOC128883193 [Hylaeus volcanicus]|uniref:uncharacterized protein LOC128883193 n=1 Tax=Hylaeus volcanicus TaxID=313075 RepID=UPI0023B7E9B0|nr:uncharacterized protein LOC128883193 [Hylaeus volcanicus]
MALAKEASNYDQKYSSKDGKSYIHPYGDVYKPLKPYPIFDLNPLFSPGTLKDSKGHTVNWEDLLGKSVALYFADYALCRCKSVLPILCNVYKTFNESGDYQKVEIVFVSLDKSEKEYAEHRAVQPWLSLPYESDIIDRFKDHYRVMHANELCKYGYGPRMTPPSLIIINRYGRLLQFLEINEQVKLWKKWDVISELF